MRKLYIKTENGKVYAITENAYEIRMTENDIVNARPAIRQAASTALTKFPNPKKGENCVFKFRGGKLSTDFVSAFYYA